jgi:GMP synthase (glutamine-hydrolysing)
MEPDLVFLSGSSHLLTRPETLRHFQEQIDLVNKAAFPVLGICFGHQLIGTAFGSGMSDLGLMVRRFEQVNVLDHHPVFDGLQRDIIVAESHRQVLTRVPAGFRRLARSTTSNIEAICHETRPIYGFQFHPERADENHPHGQILIRNLITLAGRA